MTDNLGIGAMLSYLGGNTESAEAFSGAIGKTIAKLELLEAGDKWDEGGDGSLVLTFTDGSAITLYDNARSCCESRYMSTDDDLTYHIGATLVNAGVRDGPTIESDEVKEVAFLTVTTSKGTFTINTYNEHNGYYGGIDIRAKVTKSATTPEVKDEAK